MSGAQLAFIAAPHLGLVEFLRSLDGDLGNRRHDEQAFTKLLNIDLSA